jgi:hypothetical protein
MPNILQNTNSCREFLKFSCLSTGTSIVGFLYGMTILRIPTLAMGPDILSLPEDYSENNIDTDNILISCGLPNMFLGAIAPLQFTDYVSSHLQSRVAQVGQIASWFFLPPLLSALVSYITSDDPINAQVISVGALPVHVYLLLVLTCFSFLAQCRDSVSENAPLDSQSRTNDSILVCPFK